jgi:predicted dehydrogenase
MLRVALVGLGMAVRPHAAALRELADTIEVRWAASPSAARTAAFAAEHGWRTTNDVRLAITDASVDAVIILTPPNTHLELARAALEAGKHVLVEKPLEVSLDRARELVDIAERRDRRLGVVLQHRFRPAALRLGDALAAGELGAVEIANCVVPWWRPQSYYDVPGRGTLERDGGGVLLTQAIHSLDLFRALVGGVRIEAAQSATTNLHRMECEDYAAALIRTASGGRGVIQATTAALPGEPERIEIFGDRGAARLIGERLKLSWLDGREEFAGSEGNTGGGADPMAFSHEPHRALLADFAAAVRDAREPLVNGRGALETQHLIQSLLASAGAR